jgi:hypothetical protein
MAGLNNLELVRKLADFDSWVISTSTGENISLVGARDVLWREIILKKLY